MNYWVAKANPSGYKYSEELGPGREDDWHSRYVPDELEKDDRVFLWESGSRRRIVGFGVVAKPFYQTDRDGLRVCRLRYLTAPLEWQPGIELLKESAILKPAAFLHGGAIRTFYPLDQVQAAELYRLIVAGNPSQDVWGEISGEVTLPDVDLSLKEGGWKLVQHLRRERRPELARKKKAQFVRTNGRLFCEACENEFPYYGDLSNTVFEIHHNRPIAKRKKPETTKLSDLSVLCSNCHRAIHRTKPLSSVASFKQRLGK